MMRHRSVASRHGVRVEITPSRRGYSLVEVLVSMVILLVGILAILNFFPQSLRANANAAIRAQAALLAQSKAEEVRRDFTAARPLIQTIRSMTVPTTPVPFVEDSRLSYSFCGVSLLAPVDNPGDPRDDYGVARVIVRYNEAFRPSQEILYELRFAE
jgi:prepilin-type N-terminal cleavage/methylation domain-containing protein